MKGAQIIWWGIALAMLLAAAGMQVVAGWDGDKDWLLLAARRMLEGQVLGRDVFEVNPPLVVWLFTVPVWLSNHIPVFRDYQWLTLIGVVICLCAAAIGRRLIRAHPAFEGNAHRQWMFAMLVAYTLIVFPTQVYFFDRDHIFFALTFPFVLRFIPSITKAPIGTSLRIVIGLMAGIGFCIKPHTIAVFTAIQLAILWRERSLLAVLLLENVLAGCVAVLYAFCVWRFAPGYLQEILPMVAAAYSGFERRVNGYLFLPLAFFSMALCLVEFRPARQTPFHRDAYYFITVCIGFLVYAVTNNGWGYTYNPLLCMILFLSGWMIWEYHWLVQDAKRQKQPSGCFRVGIATCSLSLGANIIYTLLIVGAVFFNRPCGNEACKPDAFTQYLQDHRVRSFSTMSMNLRRWTILVRMTHIQWVSRFNNLWMLPKLMLDGPDLAKGKDSWVADYISTAYAEDLEKHKPDAVFVDTSEGIFNYPHPVDIPLFLSRTPGFTREWSNYRKTDTIDVCPSEPEEKAGEKENVNIRRRDIKIDCHFDVYTRAPVK